MIYLDNNATTRIDPIVYHRQCEVLNKLYGNPSSPHPSGVAAKKLITKAREQVAAFIHADLMNGDKIIFTSCATESNNSVFHSVLGTHTKEKHIIISAVEHPSVMNTVAYYEKLGCRVTRIGVNSDGILDEKKLLSAIREDTVLVSIGCVNSETGVIQDVSGLTRAIRAVNENVLVHTDAVQAAGKISIDVDKLGVDFLTLSGHKFHAPKGVGALYVKKGVSFVPFLYGGHQENGMRAGTENTASIVAMGEAADLARQRLESGETSRMEKLRNAMEAKMKKYFDIHIAGENALRVGNTSNVGFKRVDGYKLVLLLAAKDICVSSGTACNSLNAEPSETLKEMGVAEEYIRSIRISFSKDTTQEDVEQLINVLKQLLGGK